MFEITKIKRYRNKKATNQARFEACTLRHSCSGGTMFCHLDELYAGKGTGIKSHDFAGFIGCDGCHRAYHRKEVPAEDVLRAVIETQTIMFANGIFK